MNANTTVRLIAAVASVCITLVLFSGVVSLADSQPAGTQLASTAATTLVR
jgi:hypothetical protein